MISINITHYIDESGDPVVKVPLTNSDEQVDISQNDFNSLIEAGIDPRWRLSNNQILERGTRLNITRLVAKAKKGCKIQLLDRNPCNLRRDNFVYSSGHSLDVTDKFNLLDRPHRFLNKVELKHTFINPPGFEQIKELKETFSQ